MENLPRKRHLTDNERRAIWEILLSKRRTNNPTKLLPTAAREVALKFGVHHSAVRDVFKRGMESLAEGDFVANVSCRKRGRVGRKKLGVLEPNTVMAIPLVDRQNIRSLAAKMQMSKSTVHRMTKTENGVIRSHSNAIKPFLTDDNKLNRVRYCMSHLDLEQSPAQFQPMMDEVHIDEKWFYLTKTNRRYYLAKGEEPPHRTAKSKRFIVKVMFMAAVARPRHDTYRNQYFDGKIGIWPFVVKTPAKRGSKNRPAGTMETKLIESISSVQVERMLIDNVLPAIRSKWPRNWAGKSGNTIKVQMDNAKTHSVDTKPDLLNEMEKDGFDIKIKFQPPNSPDMNVLDLGFFNSIQALQHQIPQRTMDDLIAATIKAFVDLENNKLNNIFLTLQQCMVETINKGGGIDYKVPHMGKSGLTMRGMLPETISCPDEVVMNGIECLGDG
jgi:hypothetical protein